MKALSLADVQRLISEEPFLAWWSQLKQAHRDNEEAESQYDEAMTQAKVQEFRADFTQEKAITMLDRAGQSENAAATLLEQASRLDNSSFKLVSDFEKQRIRNSFFWDKLNVAEKNFEEKQSTSERAVARSAFDEATLAYNRESVRKESLWLDVEKVWSQSLETRLLVSDHQVSAKKSRKHAEVLFRSAEEHKIQWSGLQSHAEEAQKALELTHEKIASLLRDVSLRFECVVSENFIFYRHARDQKKAICVSLIQDSENYNIPVSPLSVYIAERKGGVDGPYSLTVPPIKP